VIAGETALALSDEELGVLWMLAGRPVFGYVPWPELDEPTFGAVARGLAARGFIRDGDPPAMAPDVAALLEVALFADQMLRCTVNHFEPVDPGTRQEVFWRRGESIVRHVPSQSGTHRFGGCDRTAIESVVEELFALPNAAGSPTGTQLSLPETEFVGALECVERDGTDASIALAPELEGFLRALADAHPTTSIELRDRDLAGHEFSLLDSREHGLWMQSNGADRSVVVQQVSAETAGEHVSELVRMFG
jgi:hypothetical protein